MKTVASRKSTGIFPVSILYKSIAGRYRPVRVAVGPITTHYRFIKNASLVMSSLHCGGRQIFPCQGSPFVVYPFFFNNTTS